MSRPTRFAWIVPVALAITLALPPAFAAARGDEAPPNTLTEQEKADGWTLLFDGRTTSAWRGYKKANFPGGWTVVDDALTRTGGGGDLVTKEEFGDFELSLEWRIGPGGNSGVMFRVSEDKGAPYETGPEMQVLDNKLHRDGRNPLTSAGSCYALYAPLEDAAKPAGEWNQARIVAKGPKVQFFLNGKMTAEFEIGSADWNQRVGGSKFKAWDKFGKNAKGFIALQDHGDPVSYRNIKVRRLKPDGTPAAAPAPR